MTATRVESKTIPYEAAFARGLQEIPLYADEKDSLTKSFKIASGFDFDAAFIRSVAESLYEQAERTSGSSEPVSVDAIIRYDEEIQKATFPDDRKPASSKKKAKATPPAESEPGSEPTAPPVAHAAGAVDVDKIAMFSHPDPPVTAPTIIMTHPVATTPEPAYVPNPTAATDDDDTVPARQGSDTLIIVACAIVGLVIGLTTLPLALAGFTGTDSAAYYAVGTILGGLWIVAWPVAGIFTARLVLANRAKKRAAPAAHS